MREGTFVRNEAEITEAQWRKLSSTRGETPDVEDRTSHLIEGFSTYLIAFNQKPPFNNLQFQVHALAIERLRQLGGPGPALADDNFLRILRRVLVNWGLGVRGSKLLEENSFNITLRAHANEITSLNRATVDGDEHSFGVALETLQRLLTELVIVRNEAKIVAVSKTLHHLIPDLLPPIDRTYTGAFFGLHPARFQYGQERLFRTIFLTFRRVALEVEPLQFVGRAPWNTSRTKVIDNAMIGFCIAEGLLKLN